VFRTNQGTDAHLQRCCKVQEIQPFTAIVVEGYVSDDPRTIPGSHVIFTLRDETGEVDCAAYEPTGPFRDIVRAFVVGDRIRVYGGLRKTPPIRPLTINLEKVEVLELARKVELRNPQCPRCWKRMESMGSNKGYRCERCGLRDPALKKVEVEVSRSLRRGLYIPPARAHRHLTKPSTRYGLEKKAVHSLYKRISPREFCSLTFR
jgi:tRNA(Ile2)-agmatinylcytidine synthase